MLSLKRLSIVSDAKERSAELLGKTANSPRSQGRPVTGLTAGDFRVFEDGKPVQITHFYAAPGVTGKAEGVVPPIGASAEADQDLYLSIVIVDSNISQTNRRRSLEGLQTFVSQLPENSYIMLVRCTDELSIVQPFTNDRKRLRTTLDELASASGASLNAEADRIRREMQTLAEQTPPEGTSQLPDDRRYRPLELGGFSSSSALSYVHRIQTFASASAAQNEETMSQIRQLIRSVAGLHGRKVVILASDGIDTNPGTELFHDWEQIFAYIVNATNINATIEAQKYNLERPLEALVDVADGSGVTFHTITPRQVDLKAASGADREGGVTLGTGLGTEAKLTTRLADVVLAETTGGITLVNDRSLGRQLSALAEDFDSYYSLGYRPSHSGDRGFHRIRVESTGDDRSLRYREGYLDVGGGGRIEDRTLTAAVLGLTENPLGISLDCRDQEAREDGLFLVPIVVRVPLAQLSLLPQPTEHEGKVSIVIAVKDDHGNLAEMERREYPITIPHEQFLSVLQENAEFILGLVMRKGAQRVAVGVRDDIGNVDSTLTLDVDVGELAL